MTSSTALVNHVHQVCGLCQQRLFDRVLLTQENMPAAAQQLPTQVETPLDKGTRLELRQCSACATIQLTSPPVPYWRDVIRAAGISAEMRTFRVAQFSEWVTKHSLTGQKVLEVGCGRGEYLSLLVNAGVDAYGLEHSESSVIHCREHGLQVEQGFLDSSSAQVAVGLFRGFVILNFLEHIPFAHQTLLNIARQLTEDGVGLVEVPNFDKIIADRLFAEFIPDHLYYFTRSTLTLLLERSGFDVLACQPTWHDYVLSATVKKRSPTELAPLQHAADSLKLELHQFLDRFTPRRVAIWGAGHQALSLLSLLGIADRVAFVVDSAPFKQGRYTPATHLPIHAPEHLNHEDVEAVIVMAASYNAEVLQMLVQHYPAHLALATVTGQRLDVHRDPNRAQNSRAVRTNPRTGSDQDSPESAHLGNNP